MTELKLQTDIIKSIRKDGGYAHKRSNRFQVGVVDLLISYPGFCPCIAEVKDLGAVKSGFSRKLDVTPKQYEDMRRFDNSQVLNIGWGLSFILVGYNIAGTRSHFLAVTDRQADHLADGFFHFVRRGTESYYDMRLIMSKARIPRL